MTTMQPGEMSIAFGREDNPEPVLGYITTEFGKIVIVNNMSAEALLSEKEFTNIGACIVKDNTTLAIIFDNKLLLYGTRNADSVPGSNEQLWMAQIEDMFKPPPVLHPCPDVPNPMEAMASIIASATSTAQHHNSNSMRTCRAWSRIISQTTHCNPVCGYERTMQRLESFAFLSWTLEKA
jgi:hypothetical protein